MANFDYAGFKDAAVAFPTTGIHYLKANYTVGATAITTSDKLRLFALPKGALVLPELCYFQSGTVDPDATGNLTVAMKVTDGTTTKTIIAAQALQAVQTKVTASVTSVNALGLYKTGNDDFYVYLEPAVGDLDATADLQVVFAYTMDTGRGTVTT